MAKIALLFPGQGAQYVGMGQDFYNEYIVSRAVFEAANQSLGYDLASICFNGPEEELKRTEITQPAILTVGVAIWQAFMHAGIQVGATAGLSLGEYSSLVASGMLDFEQAVRLVQQRGRYMQEAVPEGVGTMAAIIGLSVEQVDEVCQQAGEFGVVEPANYNCPGQIVIGGEVEAVEKACNIALEMGARKAVVLEVSAPFHTSLLAPAAEQLATALANISFNEAIFPVVSSVTGDYITSSNQIADLLAQQVCHSVQWEETIHKLINEGYDTFVAIGPGKSLAGFMKRIDRKKKIYTITDVTSLEQTIEQLEA